MQNTRMSAVKLSEFQVTCNLKRKRNEEKKEGKKEWRKGGRKERMNKKKEERKDK